MIFLVSTQIGNSFGGARSVQPRDANNCAAAKVSKAGLVWEFEDCVAYNCDPTNPCNIGTIVGGGSQTNYCGCFSDGEAECCHIVLVSTGGGLFLPFAAGDCGTANCTKPGTCKRIDIGTTGAKAKCVAGA